MLLFRARDSINIRKVFVKLYSKHNILTLFNTFLKKTFINNMGIIRKFVLLKLLLLAGDVELNPGPLYDPGMFCYKNNNR